MNCNIVQNRLLSCDRPDLPPVDVKGHLVECPICRAWHRRIARLEQQLPKLVVPPSETKQAFLQRLVTEPVRVEQPALTTPQLVRYNPRSSSPKERGLQKMAVAFTLAAAMLLFAVGWWAWHQKPAVKSGSSEMARLLEEDLNGRLTLRLAKAGTTRERVLSMAELTDELHRNAKTLADVQDAEQLAVLARFYSHVVREYLIPNAKELPQGLRPELLETVARRLSQTESAFARLAADGNDARTTSLQTIADAAREGRQTLLAMVRGEAA